MMRRPLLRTVGRTAVIAGTASAVAGGVSRHQQNKWAEQDEVAPPVAGAAEVAAPATGGSGDSVTKLKELADLRDQGVLTEAEFNEQKAKILASMS